MESNAILASMLFVMIACLIVLSSMTPFFIQRSFRRGYEMAMEAMRFTLENSERRLTNTGEFDEIHAQNEVMKATVLPEVLIAYGVSSTSELPKNVRVTLGIRDGDADVRMEDLIKQAEV